MEMRCLRCQSPMEDMGIMRIHEGLFFVTREPFRVWRCPGCGKVEFFTSPDAPFHETDATDGAVVSELHVPAATEAIDCLECGAKILPRQDRCGQCGWTWK